MKVKDLRLGDCIYAADAYTISSYHITSLRYSEDNIRIDWQNNWMLALPDADKLPNVCFFLTFEEAQAEQERRRKHLCECEYNGYMMAKKKYDDAIELLNSPLSQEPNYLG